MPLSPLWPPCSCRVGAEQAAGLVSVPPSVRHHRHRIHRALSSGSGHHIPSLCTGLGGQAPANAHPPRLGEPQAVTVVPSIQLHSPRGPRSSPSSSRAGDSGEDGWFLSSQATHAESPPLPDHSPWQGDASLQPGSQLTVGREAHPRHPWYSGLSPLTGESAPLGMACGLF